MIHIGAYMAAQIAQQGAVRIMQTQKNQMQKHKDNQTAKDTDMPKTKHQPSKQFERVLDEYLNPQERE